VFFGRVGYIHNFGTQARDLGDVVDYRLGMGFSLNDRVSFNIQLTGAYIQRSRITAFEQSGTAGGGGLAIPVVFATRPLEILNLTFTTTVMLNKKLFIEPLVAVALNEHSFTTIGIRIPYRF
jgi:hypothetical protein